MKRGRKEVPRDILITAALAVAARDGYQNMSREAIASEAGCSAGLISKYFGTMQQLRRSIMRAAVLQGNHTVIAQGLAAHDPNARAADPKTKRDALEKLL